VRSSVSGMARLTLLSPTGTPTRLRTATGRSRRELNGADVARRLRFATRPICAEKDVRRTSSHWRQMTTSFASRGQGLESPQRRRTPRAETRSRMARGAWRCAQPRMTSALCEPLSLSDLSSSAIETTSPPSIKAMMMPTNAPVPKFGMKRRAPVGLLAEP
jgi:hypothetical protein